MSMSSVYTDGYTSNRKQKTKIWQGTKAYGKCLNKKSHAGVFGFFHFPGDGRLMLWFVPPFFSVANT